jgi:hypothetical protein
MQPHSMLSLATRQTKDQEGAVVLIVIGAARFSWLPGWGSTVSRFRAARTQPLFLDA